MLGFQGGVSIPLVKGGVKAPPAKRQCRAGPKAGARRGFTRDVLGLELLRLEEFRAGKVGFVSARVSPETIIDIRPIAAGERVTPNMDHYCLLLGPTDMHRLHAELKAKGIQVEDTVRPA